MGTTGNRRARRWAPLRRSSPVCERMKTCDAASDALAVVTTDVQVATPARNGLTVTLVQPASRIKSANVARRKGCDGRLQVAILLAPLSSACCCGTT